MAVDRGRAEAGLAELSRAYGAAQKIIASMVLDAVREGNLDRRNILMQRWLEVDRYLKELGHDTNSLARKLIENAWTEGDKSVIEALPRDRVEIKLGTINRDAMQIMQGAFTDTLDTARTTVGRQVFDVYRRAGLRSTTLGLLGARGSSSAVSQDLLDQLKAKGVKSFTAKNGAQWDLKTYTKMVARTTTREAVVAAQIQRMSAQGIDLARVSTSGNPCPVCSEWQGVLVSLSGQSTGLAGEPAATLDALPSGGPPFHPNCFVAETMVSGPREYVTSRPYKGEGIVIDVAGGNKITCTPNHPILTTRGWVAAGEILEGDDLIRCRDMKAAMSRAGINPDDDWKPAPIGEIAKSLPVVLPEMPVSAEDFHGDGLGSEVYVVHMDGLLRSGSAPAFGKHGPERDLITTDVSRRRFDGLGSTDQIAFGAGAAPHSSVCAVHSLSHGARGHARLRKSPEDRARSAPDFTRNRFGAIATLVAHDDLPSIDRLHPIAIAAADRANGAAAGKDGSASAVSADAENGRHLPERLAGIVERSRVHRIDRVALSCDVFNIKSPVGWYAAEGVIAHNCSHYLSPESTLFA